MEIPESFSESIPSTEDQILAKRLRDAFDIMREQMSRADQEGEQEKMIEILEQGKLLTRRILSLESGEGDVDMGAEFSEGKTTLEEAEKIMGEQFLGPEIIKETFGIEMKTVPPVPFSKKELLEAKKRGEELVLHAAISIEDMNKRRKGKAKDGNKLLYWTSGDGTLEGAWYKDEAFATEKPQEGWKLTSKEVVEGTTSNNYLEQTQALIDHLASEIFKGGAKAPKEYIEAMNEFNDNKAKITELLGSDWEKAVEALEKLKITKLVRETPTEALYRLILNEAKTGEKSLPFTYSWTSRRSSSYGDFVLVGPFGSEGVRVLDDAPGRTTSGLGACLSRRG